MRLLLTGAAIMTTTMLLASCRVIVTQPNNVCTAHDRRGRTWTSGGPNACQHAIRRCRRWHFNNTPRRNWRCFT